MMKFPHCVGFGAAFSVAVFFASYTAYGRTVNAADFGYSAADSTAALQAAIDSGAKKVIVDGSRGDWCINPIRLRSDLEIVFAANTKVRAMPGAYRSKGCKMFTAKGVTNLVLRGEPGASLSMCKRDYLDETRYEWSEWRHLIALYDSKNISVTGLSISSSGGDGIYINACEDVKLEDTLFVDNNRQGVSVIGVDGLTIRRCRFTATEGTPPACGLDFEPNKPGNRISSVVVEDCEFDGNFSSGVTFPLVRLNAKSHPVSAVLRRCRFTGNGLAGVRVHPSWSGDGCVSGEISIEDCVFAANMRGALVFAWMPPSRFRVNIKNSLLDCRGSAAAPVTFDNGIAHYDFGGVGFENVKVLSDRKEPIEFYGMTGVGVTNVSGALDVETPSGKHRLSLAEFAKRHPIDPNAREFRPARVKDELLRPLSSMEQVPSKPVFCRGTSHFVQYSPTPGERRMRFLLRKPEGVRVNPDVSVTVFDMKGTLVETIKLEAPETEYVLKSSVPNVHTFKIVGKRNLVAVESPWSGRGVLANTRLLLGDMEGRSVYFGVPAKSKGFRMEFLVKSGNSLSFKVLDSSGKVRAARSLENKGCIIDIDRKPTEGDEIWTVAVDRSKEPFHLRFGGNVTPVVFDDPAAGVRQASKGEPFAGAVGVKGSSESVSSVSGVSKSGYLDLMEAAVRAYSDERINSYYEESFRDGVQEHGFPRLAANLAILVANGRLSDRRELVRKMLDVCCRDAPKGKMPPRSGGNEFSVKELVIAIVELEKRGIFPKDVTDAWRRQLRRVDAMRCYRYAEIGPGELRGRNWQLFASSSEQARIRYGFGGDAGYVETYVADQSRWFDSNGLYRDPHQPPNYDFVSRIQFAEILHDGYDGPARAELEKYMDLAAEPTLKMLSACGEIPYGGRSNQFLLNNTLYSSLCEWYAARYAKRGDVELAKQFRRAAKESVDAMRFWLDQRPVSHVKNRYPRKTGKVVYAEEADIGCERYAYFDKYMITMGSWALLGWYFVDESIPAAGFTPVKPEVFLASPTFHFALMRAGEYSAQFNYWADTHYDCDGLGRLHRRGAPAELCMSVPCPREPIYRLPEPNASSFAIRPVTAENAEWRILHEARTDKFALTQWKVGDLELECRLSDAGMEMALAGEGEVAMDLPAFDFDGKEQTRIDHDDRSLSVSHRGWTCRYRTDGRIVPTGRSFHNRNGRYKAFRATGADKLTVSIEIERSSK